MSQPQRALDDERIDQFLGNLLLLVMLYYVGKTVGPGTMPALTRYGGNFLSFTVIGLAFARYFQLTLRMFSESIRTAQLSGCLEAMLSSQTDALTIVLMSSLYGLLSGAAQPVLILVAGALVMGVDLSHMNFPATMLVLAFSVLTFVSFGVLSAATILWLKKGDPLAWILGGMGTMLGGAYFPIDVLPPWLRQVSFLIPITYSLDALRLTMLKGYSLEMVAHPLLVLALMAAILLPASLAIFAAMVRKGRIEGTLMQY